MKENRLYKHTCKNNELCNRTNNQDVYIDLCSIDNLDDYFENNLKININKLKNDLDYKKEYLKKKKIKNNEYAKKQRKKEIEQKYKSDFEEYTFKKEAYEFNLIKSSIENQLNYEASQSEISNINLRTFAQNFWYNNQSKLKYSISKKKLKAFIENIRGQTLYEEVRMSKYEYKEFQKYILEREPVYRELMNIDDYNYSFINY